MSDESREFHKPVRRPAEVFDRRFAAEDPAEVSRVAHSTAQALLARGRADPTGEVVDRLVSFTAEHGIDDLAELWSRSPSRSLPGALWRLYLLQLMIHDDAARPPHCCTSAVAPRSRPPTRSSRAPPARQVPTSSSRWSTRSCAASSRGTSRSPSIVPPHSAACRPPAPATSRTTTRPPSPSGHRLSPTARAAPGGLRERPRGVRGAVADGFAELTLRNSATRRGMKVPGRRTPLGAWPLAAAEDGARGYCGPAIPF